jgi:anti-sigma regulatory factor (Ser/Thr protein kinase)
MVPQLELRLRPDANSPAEARRSLEALRPGLNDLLVDDAVLLVSEVVSNSVRHGCLDDTDAIEVRVRRSRSKLRVDVMDPGPGFDPRRVGNSQPDGGWGLKLLDRLATRWGVEREDGTRVWFELNDPVSPDIPSGT